MYTTLNGIAKIATETIFTVENFLTRDGNAQTRPATNVHSLEEEEHEFYSNDEGGPDADAAVDMDRMDSSDTGVESSDMEGIRRQWLRKSLIAASINLDFLVIAAVQKFVVLKQVKKNLNNVAMEIAAKIEVLDEEHAYISAIAIFGIQPSRSNFSSHSLTSDWTCICVGLSNGKILFYTERGTQIFVEQCSHSQIEAIRLGPSTHPGNQELVALSAGRRLVVIEGLSLYTTLRAARTQIAQGNRTVAEICSDLQLNGHQLLLDRLHHVTDFQPLGLSKPATFDQYMSAFLAAGRNETLTRTQLPVYTYYMCSVGHSRKRERNESISENEFVAFLWHDSQTMHGGLTDALLSITSHISNSIPSFGVRSFLGVGTSRKDRPAKQSVVDAKSSSAQMKSALRDHKRVSERSFLAPQGWPFVALADNMGRVVLVHTKLKRILRIWKGYRQARCAWIESNAKSQGNSSRRALFLVIFAPKRGLLEVWAMQNGPRVSAFEVDENSRLLSMPSCRNGVLFGGADVELARQEKASTSAIILSPDGYLYSIDVPFHLSALASSTTAVYDENLIREFNLNHFTKKPAEGENSAVDLEKLMAFVQRIKTTAAKQRFLDILIASSAKDKSQMCGTKAVSAECILDIVTEMTAADETQSDLAQKGSNNISPYLRTIKSAIELFLELKHYWDECIGKGAEEAAANNETLQQQRADAIIPQKVVSFIQRGEPVDSRSSTIAALSSCRLNLHEFLGCLNLSAFRPNVEGQESSLRLELREHSSESKGNHPTNERLAATVFAPFLVDASLDLSLLFCRILAKMDTKKDMLIALYISFWLDSNWNSNSPEQFAPRFSQILHHIFVEFKDEGGQEALSTIKAFSVVETMALESTNLRAALQLALQMQNICEGLLQSIDKQHSPVHDSNEGGRSQEEEHFIVVDDSEMELQANLRSETIHFWQLSSLHLSALSLLQYLYIQTEQQVPPLNLIRIVQKGIGFYREQIGIWISQLDGDVMSAQLFASILSREDDLCDNGTASGPTNVSGALTLLGREIFPQSLRIELVLCDCVWECAGAWFKGESRRVHKLERAAEFLESLHSVPKLQHGLAVLLWDTFIVASFKKLFLMVEEQMGHGGPGGLDGGGRFPLEGKDRILRKEVLVVETDLRQYLNCVRRLLEILAESCCQLGGRQDIAYGPLVGALNLEDAELKEFVSHAKIRHLVPSNKRGNAVHNFTLVRLVDAQKLANYHLVVHHVHLVSSMEMQINVISNSYTKPSALFDPTGKRAFFSPLDTHPLLLMSRVDDRTKARRQRFVENYMEGLQKMEGAANSEEVGKRFAELRRVLNRLIKDWELDVTILQIREIAKLYLDGSDDEAERRGDKLAGNRQKLALELVPIIAGRIKTLLDGEETELSNKISQRSAASKSTLDFVKNTPAEHIPNFERVGAVQLRRLISVARVCLDSRMSNAKTSAAAGRREEPKQMDFTKCQQLLREFDEICGIAEWLESN